VKKILLFPGTNSDVTTVINPITQGKHVGKYMVNQQIGSLKIRERRSFQHVLLQLLLKLKKALV